MATTVTENSKELLSRLIRNEFNNIDFSLEYIYRKADALITAAKEYGLSELAEQLESDKLVF